MHSAKSQNGTLAPLSRGTLLFLLGVILWGSFVRASGSGAGCGNHWPLCNGVVLPESPTWKTIVEFTHRVTSGLSLLLCAGVCLVAFREKPRGSLARKAGLATLILILLEAVIGAGLVLLRLVEQDQSALRAVSMSIHLMNTFLLLMAVTLTADWARIDRPAWKKTMTKDRVWAAVAALLVMGLAASGAVTALGDTLFPAQSLRQGFAQDLAPSRHFLIALRLYHPVFAIAVSFYLALFSRRVIRANRGSGNPGVLLHAVLILTLQCAQLLLGVLNVLLLAPVAIQMLHLFFSDLVWINLTLLLSRLFICTGITQTDSPQQP